MNFVLGLLISAVVGAACWLLVELVCLLIAGICWAISEFCAFLSSQFDNRPRHRDFPDDPYERRRV